MSVSNTANFCWVFGIWGAASLCCVLCGRACACAQGTQHELKGLCFCVYSSSLYLYLSLFGSAYKL